MIDESVPPAGCVWWRPGSVTINPPEDELFLRKLSEAGFATYVGPLGLVGAKNGTRSIVVIHRGRGRRWEITLRDDEFDRYVTNSTKLPDRALAGIAWLCGEPLEKVRPLLEAATAAR
jgi:hypothetical protein